MAHCETRLSSWLTATAVWDLTHPSVARVHFNFNCTPRTLNPWKPHLDTSGRRLRNTKSGAACVCSIPLEGRPRKTSKYTLCRAALCARAVYRQILSSKDPTTYCEKPAISIEVPDVLLIGESSGAACGSLSTSKVQLVPSP
jgi:hypothetical protein